ncbi:hypothetical protein DBV15_07748 [Temnothorax longispinosus]|uniref:Uncharacterized protein n=1 Tax=Temnothorax longispinosus TaxID=300112 RepID=A0A4S2KWQ7_9HYME|nr:hypothetical protein DBV15_07748 [Temnothorax longispinosus]
MSRKSAASPVYSKVKHLNIQRKVNFLKQLDLGIIVSCAKLLTMCYFRNVTFSQLEYYKLNAIRDGAARRDATLRYRMAANALKEKQSVEIRLMREINGRIYADTPRVVGGAVKVKNIHGKRCECSRGRLKSQSNALEPQSHNPTSKATVIKVWCLHNVFLLANYLEFKSTLTGLTTLANYRDPLRAHDKPSIDSIARLQIGLDSCADLALRYMIPCTKRYYSFQKYITITITVSERKPFKDTSEQMVLLETVKLQRFVDDCRSKKSNKYYRLCRHGSPYVK